MFKKPRNFIRYLMIIQKMNKRFQKVGRSEIDIRSKTVIVENFLEYSINAPDFSTSQGEGVAR